MASLPGCRRWGNVFLSPPTFNYRRDTLHLRVGFGNEYVRERLSHGDQGGHSVEAHGSVKGVRRYDAVLHVAITLSKPAIRRTPATLTGAPASESVDTEPKGCFDIENRCNHVLDVAEGLRSHVDDIPVSNRRPSKSMLAVAARVVSDHGARHRHGSARIVPAASRAWQPTRALAPQRRTQWSPAASSGQQRTRVLTNVKALRSTPPPLRGAVGLDAGSAHARQIGPLRRCPLLRPSRIAPMRATVEHVVLDQGHPPRVVRLDLIPDHAAAVRTTRAEWPLSAL